MPIRLALSSSREGEWYITAGGTYLVGFSGPQARELALRQQQELAELMNRANSELPARNKPGGVSVGDD